MYFFAGLLAIVTICVGIFGYMKRHNEFLDSQATCEHLKAQLVNLSGELVSLHACDNTSYLHNNLVLEKFDNIFLQHVHEFCNGGEFYDNATVIMFGPYNNEHIRRRLSEGKCRVHLTSFSFICRPTKTRRLRLQWTMCTISKAAYRNCQAISSWR